MNPNPCEKGDLVFVNGLNTETNQEETWYGEVVEVKEDGVDVFFLEKTNKCNGFIWSYGTEWHTIPKDTIRKSIRPQAGSYVKAYEELGFGPTEVENEFVFLEDEERIPLHVSMPMRLDSSVNRGGEQYEEDGFLTLDESQQFTQAQNDSAFVNEMHTAVNDYNHWVPEKKFEQQIKAYIDDLATRVATEDDDKQFANGTSVDYLNPPVNPLNPTQSKK